MEVRNNVETASVNGKIVVDLESGGFDVKVFGARGS